MLYRGEIELEISLKSSYFIQLSLGRVLDLLRCPKFTIFDICIEYWDIFKLCIDDNYDSSSFKPVQLRINLFGTLHKYYHPKYG